MWCDYCQRPVAGQKHTKKVAKLSAVVFSGGLYTPGLIPGGYHCPNCGQPVRPMRASDRSAAGSAPQFAPAELPRTKPPPRPDPTAEEARRQAIERGAPWRRDESLAEAAAQGHVQYLRKRAAETSSPTAGREGAAPPLEQPDLEAAADVAPEISRELRKKWMGEDAEYVRESEAEAAKQLYESRFEEDDLPSAAEELAAEHPPTKKQTSDAGGAPGRGNESLQENRPDQDERRAGSDLPEQLERLARLHERGNLTDDEFKAAKKRLLYGPGS